MITPQLDITFTERCLTKDKIPGLFWVQINHGDPNNAKCILWLLLFQKCQEVTYKRGKKMFGHFILLNTHCPLQDIMWLKFISMLSNQPQ